MFKSENSKNMPQLRKKMQIMENISKWYNGYSFSYIDSKNKTIIINLYNPYSVMNYLT